MDSNMSNSGSGTGNPSDGPAAFLSQPFSAATEMILKRLRGEGGLVNHDLTSGLQASAIGAAIPGYDDVRRSVMNSMRTSSAFAVSTSTPTPSVLGKKSRASRGSASGTPSGVKRQAGNRGGKKKKRKIEESEEEEEESDSLSDMGDSDSSLSEDEENTTPAAFPAVTQSGRKVVRPSQFVPEPVAKAGKGKGAQGKGQKGKGKKVKDEMCMRCGRGHSPKTNMIVFCDGCDRGWHQMCHDPMIRDEVVREEGTEWFCSECTEKRELKNRQKMEKEAEARRRSRNSTPSRPLAPEPKRWEEMSEAEKRQHLSSMPHYHLVDLLISAKSMFPSIPITPLSTSSSRYLNGRIDDRRTNIHRQQPFPPSAAQGLFSRADANPSGQLNYIRKVPPGSTLPMSNAAMSRQNSSTPRPRSAGPTAPAAFGQYQSYTTQSPAPQQSYHNTPNNDADAPGEDDTSMNTNGQVEQQKPHLEEEEDDSPPPSPPYPKPGNGLMSRLKSDDQDLEWLVGNEREGEAFSHLVFEQDGAGMAQGGQGNVGGQNAMGGNMGGMGGMMMS